MKRGSAMRFRIQQRVACKLLDLSEEEFRQIARMDPAAETQRSYDVIRIARALAILLPHPRRPAEWMRAENSGPIFKNQSALELIETEVGALEAVRRYLEAELYR